MDQLDPLLNLDDGLMAADLRSHAHHTILAPLRLRLQRLGRQILQCKDPASLATTGSELDKIFLVIEGLHHAICTTTRRLPNGNLVSRRARRVVGWLLYVEHMAISLAMLLALALEKFVAGTLLVKEATRVTMALQRIATRLPLVLVSLESRLGGLADFLLSQNERSLQKCTKSSNN